MAIAKVNDTPAADIGKANSVPIANIAKFSDVEAPVGGQTATRWVAAHDGNGSDWYISYAAHSDRTSWTGTTTISSSSPDTYWLAYGKDGSGGNLWAAVTSSNSIEIAHDGNNDVTDGSTWTAVDSDSASEDLQKCRTIAWGNDVWVAMGHMDGSNKELYRSTDGASWAEVNLASVSGIGTQTVYGLASDGQGTWIFGQSNKIFVSTDNASTWAEMTSYPGTAVADVGFTNNTWVILGAASPGNVNTVSASALATEMGGGSAATWGEQDVDAGGGNTINIGTSGGTRGTMACGGGVVVVAHPTNTMAFDVNGSTITVRSSGKVAVGNGNTIGGSINTIATDGNGVWLVGSDGASADGGGVGQSLDNGATWTEIVNDFTYNGDRKFEALRANVHLPV